MLALFAFALSNPGLFAQSPTNDYTWTTDHMHVGTRWQPFYGKPAANLYDSKRPVLATHSSYVQFWVSWAAMEPQESDPRNA